MGLHDFSGVDGVVGWSDVDDWYVVLKLNKYRRLKLYKNMRTEFLFMQRYA